MIIQIDKFYRTRQGRKAFVRDILPLGTPNDYPVRGYVVSSKGSLIDTNWTREGFWLSASEPNTPDLVAEWSGS